MIYQQVHAQETSPSGKCGIREIIIANWHMSEDDVIILYYAIWGSTKVEKKYKRQVHNKKHKKTENYKIDSNETALILSAFENHLRAGLV